MHKYYKEHFLYNVKPEKINSVHCHLRISGNVGFNLVDGLPFIDCGDNETAKIVYKDICTRLTANRKFVRVGNYLINISRIKGIGIEYDQQFNLHSVNVLYKGNSSDKIGFNDINDANKVYKYLTEQFNEYKANNGNQSTTEETLNR